jgi:hypothetical protein
MALIVGVREGRFWNAGYRSGDVYIYFVGGELRDGRRGSRVREFRRRGGISG